MDEVFDIYVDVQGDFMKRIGALPVEGAEDIIPALQAEAATLDSYGALFLYDTHFRTTYYQTEEAQQFPNIHCEKDTPGWQLVVDPTTVPAGLPVYTMEKGVFDMWKEPGLHIVPLGQETLIDRDDFFANMRASGVKKLRIRGVAADYCVKDTIDGALARGFEVEVIAALTVGIQRSIQQVVAEDYADQPVTII